MRVLVTGGAGFIGSHVVDALLARGDDVIAVDDLVSGRAGRLDPQVTLHKLSVTDPARPDARSSTAITSSPLASRASTTWEPMKPAPPVTSTRIPGDPKVRAGLPPAVTSRQHPDTRRLAAACR